MKTSKRSERAKTLGLDCPDTLTWRSWEPATMYSKKLVLKNVGTKVQRVKHGLPKSKFFRVEFPKRVQIPPGVSYSITVSFTPFQRQEYTDSIDVVVSQVGGIKERFSVLLQATLPRLSVVVDPSEPLEFRNVAVSKSGVLPFSLRNASADVSVSFEWCVVAPFSISPTSGSISPGESATFNASFSPTDAAPYSSVAVCSLNGNTDFRTLQMAGRGRYAFFQIAPQQADGTGVGVGGEVDFGQVSPGHTSALEIPITNPSLVPCTVNIKRGGGSNADLAFEASPTSFELASGATANVKISFTPRACGVHHSGYFLATSPNAPMTAPLRLCCSGSSGRPGVSIGPQRSVTFGAVAVGTSTSRMIAFSNPSDDNVSFEFATDDSNNNDVFRFDPPRGSIPKKGTSRVAVRFHPSQAVAFAKRVFCVIDHQPPLSVDVMGTGFLGDGGERPPTIFPRHIEAIDALLPQDSDLKRLPPERLSEALIQREKEQANGRRKRVAHFSEAAIVATTPRPTTTGSTINQISPIVIAQPAELWNRFLQSVITNKSSEISILESNPIDFGQVTVGDDNKQPHSIPLRVHNGTLGRVSCIWVNNISHPFSITPAIIELDPNQTFTFQVCFSTFLSISISIL